MLTEAETSRTCSSRSSKFCREEHFLKVPGETGRICRAERSRSDDVDAGQHCRPICSWRYHGCSRDAGPCYGGVGADGTRWRQMGAGVDPVSHGGPTIGNVSIPSCCHEPAAEGFQPAVPTRVGHNCLSLHQRGGHHHQPSPRSYAKAGRSRATPGEVRRLLRSCLEEKAQEPEVDKEACSRRTGLMNPGDADLCSGVSDGLCQAAAEFNDASMFSC